MRAVSGFNPTPDSATCKKRAKSPAVVCSVAAALALVGFLFAAGDRFASCGSA
jgi:hypothetical protein